MQRVVLVTGAASGVGAAVCRAMARPGVSILAHTRANALWRSHKCESIPLSFGL
jgi:NAD(P)-dependent dehydrogenase (short-subunit alcohol dehydrogenase family)